MTRDERGQVGGLDAVLVGVLVFIVGVLIVANAWGVLDAKLAASGAARQAARAYVEAPSASSALPDARSAAALELDGHGRDPARMGLRLLAGGFARCQRVTIEVSYPVPLIRIPLLGGAGTGFVARARHSEIVDPYRRGLPGTAACA